MSEVRIAVERDPDLEGLVTITLDRPDKLNALDVAMHEALQPVLVELETDISARVVILAGRGRAFSAGADLRSRRSTPPVNDLDRLAMAHQGGRTCDLLERLPQVTIAAIGGLAVGGGVVLALACDLRLAAESAWFSIPEVELGLPLTWHALPRLMRELGPARTKELVMACERFSAADAERWGLVNRVVADGEVDEAARSLAERLLSMDPLTLSASKGACDALANAMVPKEVTWSDPELMLLAYRQRAAAERRREGEPHVP